jgi:hypothetical protein
MAVQVISTTELRTDTKRLVIGLRAGDTFLIQHYREIVGYINPKVPRAMLKQYAEDQKAQPKKRARKVKRSS